MCTTMPLIQQCKPAGAHRPAAHRGGMRSPGEMVNLGHTICTQSALVTLCPTHMDAAPIASPDHLGGCTEYYFVTRSSRLTQRHKGTRGPTQICNDAIEGAYHGFRVDLGMGVHAQIRIPAMLAHRPPHSKHRLPDASYISGPLTHHLHGLAGTRASP